MRTLIELTAADGHRLAAAAKLARERTLPFFRQRLG